jgi:tryptophan synthase alpha chain
VSRLSAAFARRKVLVSYLCVGDPSVEESVELALVCAGAGSDVLELGVPFSDPTADGPTIARASQRAIAAGGGLDATLHVAATVRARAPDVGIVLFGYYNPVFVQGEERTARRAGDAGADALLLVDLPLEESGALARAGRAVGVGLVPLLAPTSLAARVEAVRSAAPRPPFVYYVSTTGVTGSAAVDAGEAGEHASRLRDTLGLPVVVGFGIDGRDRARAAAAGADGIVVGTALVRAIETTATAEARRAAVEKLVRSLRAGVDEAAGALSSRPES